MSSTIGIRGFANEAARNAYQAAVRRQEEFIRQTSPKSAQESMDVFIENGLVKKPVGKAKFIALGVAAAVGLAALFGIRANKNLSTDKAA